MRLVAATRNEHKLRELAEILAGVELVPLPDGGELPAEAKHAISHRGRAARAMARALGLAAPQEASR